MWPALLLVLVVSADDEGSTMLEGGGRISRSSRGREGRERKKYCAGPVGRREAVVVSFVCFWGGMRGVCVGGAVVGHMVTRMQAIVM